jgi:hypothetical protein
MKRWSFTLFFLCIAFSVQADDATRKSLEEYTRQASKPLIPKEARFRPDGNIIVSGTHQTETGTYNGIKYMFSFTDGRGTFEGAPGNTLDSRERIHWGVRCWKDPIDDHKSCGMYSKQLWIVVIKTNKQEQVFVSVGKNHYPGSTVAIRISDEKPFVTNAKDGMFNAMTSSIIIQKLKTNPKVAIRYQEWPKDFSTDEVFQVFGFPETYEYINWAVQKIK